MSYKWCKLFCSFTNISEWLATVDIDKVLVGAVSLVSKSTSSDKQKSNDRAMILGCIQNSWLVRGQSIRPVANRLVD